MATMRLVPLTELEEAELFRKCISMGICPYCVNVAEIRTITEQISNIINTTIDKYCNESNWYCEKCLEFF